MPSFRRPVVLVFFALAACGGSSSSSDAGADGALSDAASDAPLDSPTPVDAVTPADAATDTAFSDATSTADAPPGDGAACADAVAQCPHPPAGYTQCGTGAVDGSAAATACNSVDPPLDLNMGLTKSCDSFSIATGHYEVWCGPTDVYVWVSLDSLSSPDVIDCPLTVPSPDGGTITVDFYQLQWDLKSSNNIIYAKFMLAGGGGAGGSAGQDSQNVVSDDRAMDSTGWQGSLAFEAQIHVGGSPSAGGNATVYVTAGNVDCNRLPTSGDSPIVLAVPVTWPAAM